MLQIPVTLLLAASAFLAANSRASAQIWSQEKTDFVSSGLPALFVSTGKAKSIAVGVSIKGQAVMTAGFGEAKPGVPATAETIYQIGSVSKQFTAAAILALIEDAGGFPPRYNFPIIKKAQKPYITLATDIEKFFPAAKQWTTTPPITVRHLLNMQSGFPSYTGGGIANAGVPDIDTTKPITKAKLLTAVSNLLTNNPSKRTADNVSDYSNTNYFLLANILDQKVPPTSPVNYKSYLRERVFKKAGMTWTGFVDDYAANSVVADPKPDVTNAEWNKPAWPMGAGEIASNVIDMQKWHAALMGGKIFKPGTRAIMFSGVAPGSSEASYAMGWTVLNTNTHMWATHWGTVAGYRAYDGILKEQTTNVWVSVSILINADLAQPDADLLVASADCIALLAMDASKTLKDLASFTKAKCGIT